MSWWNDALYDTCSLITLDKILRDHDGLCTSHFTSVLAIEHSFSADQMRAETRGRMQPRAKVCDLPPLADLNRILSAAKLPCSLSEVDKLHYAVAVHHRHCLMTADKDLARVIVKEKLKVGNIALVLKELVLSKCISVSQCNAILGCLVNRKDCILGNHAPTWKTLQKYRFP